MGNRVDDLLNAYRQLFSGNTSFYGVHKYRASKPGEKEEGDSWTEDKNVTEKQYKDHLNGIQGLGICPIREDSTCAFGAIDVDVYNDSEFIELIINIIYKWKLPLLPFRSKSGGLHLYLFIEADPAIMKLPSGSETIRLLSRLSNFIPTHPLNNKRHEIFPKQSKAQVDKKGNWINLPYFNTDNSRQYLIGKDYKQMSFDKAVEIIQSKKTTYALLEQYLETLPFSDGPPCLQTITLYGGPKEGERNVFMFNAAIYFKEKDHTAFDIMLDELNDDLLSPLDSDEIDLIKRSVIKKEYTYACHESPLCDNCNKEVCATKDYGIGKNNGLFMGLDVGQLTVHRGKGVSYSLEVTYENNTSIIRFDSPRDLRNQDVFIDAVLMNFNYLVSRVKTEKWSKIINGALEIATEDEPDLADENTMQSRVTKLVLEFIIKHITKNKIDLERGFAFIDDNKGEILLKADDLWKFLVDNNKQRNLKDADYQQILSGMGVDTKTTRVGKKVMRVRTARVADIEEMLGGKLEPLQDINWDEAAKSEDY